MPAATKTKKPAKPPAKAKKAKAEPALVEPPKGQRRLRLPAYRLFRRKRVQHPEKLPNIWVLTGRTAAVLWRHKALFLGLLLVYALLDLVLVRGLASAQNVDSLKQQSDLGIGGIGGALSTGLLVFGSLLTSPGSNNASAGAYQLFLGIIISLATIWTLRQLTQGQRVSLRDVFYKSMYPLAPFVLVLVVVLLETLPLLAGGYLYSLAVNTGIAATVWEQIIFGVIFAALTVVTIYFLCSSIFALYIVTLPDMTPRKALKSARQLVAYRRAAVFRKLLYLPVALLVVAAVIMLPVIILVSVAAVWVLFVLSLLALVVAHAYIYTVYKALLA